MKTSYEETDTQELLFEYEQLRNEILQNDVLILQVLGATILIVSTIVGFAFSEAVQNDTAKGILFFLAEIIALIGLSRGADKRRMVFVIGSYLRIFTEERLREVKWETRLLRFRELSPGRGYGELMSSEPWTYGFIVIAAFIGGTWFIMQDILGTALFSFVVILLVIWFIVTALLLWRIRNQYTAYVRQHNVIFDPIWKKIRDEVRVSKLQHHSDHHPLRAAQQSVHPTGGTRRAKRK